MSEATTPPLAVTIDAATVPAEADAPKPWLAQVWADTTSRLAARLGLIWIAVIATCAVFAPLLASSFPILAKIDGQWSSPWAQRLTAADISLFITFFAALVLYFMPRPGFGTKVCILIGLALLSFLVARPLVRPPLTEVYEEYRVMEREGKIEWALWAPVPYSVGDRMRDVWGRPHPWAPSAEHWAGTDVFGADILSHLIHACRIAMAIGFISTGLALLIGIIVGGLMGYFAGLADLLGMRLVEIFGAIPTIYLLLTFIAAFPEYRSIYLIMAIIGLTSWVGDARFMRAEVLKLRNQDFVQAAVAAGVPLRSVLWRHLLPNAVAPLLVSASFGIAGAILAETTLSFLGLGIPIGDASWGSLLNQAVSAGGGFNWWLAIFPGVAIFLTVLSYNMIGEALRDAIDPRTRRQGM